MNINKEILKKVEEILARSGGKMPEADTSKFDEMAAQLTALNTKIDNLSDMINRMLSLKKVDDTPQKEGKDFFQKLFSKD